MDFHIKKVEQFNNIQEAHFHQMDKSIDQNSPHIVICPQCNEESYRFNEYCNNGKCTFGIRAYFDELNRIEYEKQYRQKRLKQQTRHTLYSLLAFLGSLSGAWLAQFSSILGLGIFFIGLLLALGFNHSAKIISDELK